MRYLFLLILFFSGASLFAQKVTLRGIAPTYVGKTIEIKRIDDYLSDKQSVITRAEVLPDSTFSLSFFTKDIEKIVVTSENNWGFLYVEPNASYEINFPDRNPFDPVKPSGNQVELSFLELDSTDINYKILAFQRWIDYFIGSTYHLRNDKESALFTAELDTFKMNVYNYYDQDTSGNSYFLKTYVRFSIAGLDNINTIAERNRYEKYDFYLKDYPVSYKNDVYMEYLSSFYEKAIPRLPNELNELFYQGILESSPTILFNSLAKEYTLRNPRIREFVIIQALSEAYYSKDYPKTNIETILDSLAQNSLFKEHEKIAKNILARLTDLVPGSKAPDFVLRSAEDVHTLTYFNGKHLYLHFLDPHNKDNIRELEVMQEMYGKYKDYVEFVSIYKSAEDIPKNHIKQLESVEWPIYAVKSDNSVLEKYQVTNFSHFVLIDAAGYIVASPALTPTPDGEYETIDRTFYYLKEALDRQEE